MEKIPNLNKSYQINLSTSLQESESEKDRIFLSDQDKERIYQPWRFDVIVKLLGRKVSHQLLKSKINDLWKPKK